MRTRRLRNIIYKGVAWLLTVVLLLSYAERLGGGVIDVQAKEDTISAYSDTATGNGMMDGCGVISLGREHSAAIKSDGSLWMWGNNNDGGLGIGDKSLKSSSVPMHVLDDVKSVSVSKTDNMSMAITSDNSLWIWGSSYGFLLSKEECLKPYKIMENVKSVFAGTNYGAVDGGGVGTDNASIAVIKDNDSLWMLDKIQKKFVKIMDDVRTVSVGYHHIAIVKMDGSLWMWGSNTYGQLGNGTYTASTEPIKIMDNVQSVSLGEVHSAAIKEDGSLWTWGCNFSGQLGIGKLDNGKLPDNSNVPIKIMDGVKSVSFGTENGAAIKQDGSLWMWGYDGHGQMGLEDGDRIITGYDKPIKIMDGVLAVSIGDRYSAAVKSDGSLWTWGSNKCGKIGNGVTENELSCVRIQTQIMPPGSIAVSSVPSPSTPKFNMNIEKQDKPRIKVVDEKGKPIENAKVTHLGVNAGHTSTKGYTYLEYYQEGEPISISKAGYYTLDTAFHQGATGCTTYVLSDHLSGVILTLDGEDIDVLTKEAIINKYDNVAKKFSIKCLFNEEIYSYAALCSGDKFIADTKNGIFNNLRIGDFNEGEVVTLELYRPTDTYPAKKKLEIQVIDLNPQVGSFSFGENLAISIPENIPIVGGRDFEINLGDSPVEVEVTSDGEIHFGINVAELCKKDKNWFETIKRLNKNNVGKVLDETDSGDTKKNDSSPDIDTDVKVIGYLEGNVLSRDYINGKLFVEFSAEAAWEQQYTVVVVPVVVEISVSGKVNADGTITFREESGFSGSVNVGGELGLGLYGGVGIKKVASVGVYGEAGIGINVNLLPTDNLGIEKLYVRGEAGVKAKYWNLTLKDYADASKALIDGTYYIIPESVNGKTGSFAIDNNMAYAQLSRNYLQSDGTMPKWTSENYANIDGSIGETALQSSTCLDIVPQVLRMGDTVMLFYLSDAGVGRSAADRSMLVYSLWDADSQNWSEPKAVMDDRTADFAPDLYTDGKKIYAVWQNAKESLEGNLTLNETADKLVLHAAVYDAVQDRFVDLGAIESENGLCQQSPQIVADGENVSVYWYENEEDNVLGLSGTNRIYQAVLGNTADASKMAVQSAEEEQEKSEEEKDDSVEDSKDSENENPMEDTGISENSIFRKYVALKEEVTEEQETVSENDPSEIEKEEEETDHEEANENKTDKDNDSVSENTISENTVSENTLNSVMADGDSDREQAGSPWQTRLLQEEDACIISADAGRTDGETGYAYVAGTLNGQYDVTQSHITLLAQDKAVTISESGAPENVEFASVYAGETLTWYQGGDIHYMDESNKEVYLFGESRLPSSSYTLLSDGAGSPEVIFPVNMSGKSNLYRIGYENGAFLAALPITEQEDYIQYADGFVSGGRTILVYNRMEVNDQLEEVNNSLYMGTLEHQYYDIGIKSAGSTIRRDAETGEDVLEIMAQLYNNGTIQAEQMSLSLAKDDGTVLETVLLDTVLEAGVSSYATAVFSMDNITEESAYTLTLLGAEESNQQNNSVSVTLGNAALQVNAEVITVGGTRTLQAGIRNNGVTACGGTVSVRNSETGEEYCSSDFEPITIGQTVFAEVEIDQLIFAQRDAVVLEVIVTPDADTSQSGRESEIEVVSDYVVVYAPSYEVSFVTDTGTTTVYTNYGTQVSFPENPTKEGKHFIGWYDAENLSAGTLYTEEMPVTKDLTLYACFADEERAQIPLSECSVSTIPMQYYTGGQLKPKVTVKWGSEVLKENKDYKVTYRNNKEQGKATAVITAVTGNGKKYTGSIERNFSIMYPTSKVSVKAIPAVSFTGETHTPDPVVTYQKKTLVKDRDYTVSYFNNRNAGTAGVTITGKGTFSGEKTVTFKINGTAITGMKFGKISDVTYNGKNTRPVVTVKTKDGKTQLMSGSDYRLVYENTVNKGTATVTVIGNGNYTGTKKLAYKVVAKPLEESMVSVEQPSASSLVVAPEKAEYTYTGKPIKPALNVTDEAAGDTALVLNKDYTVSYSKNKAVGEAQIMVKGKGNYSGTVKVPFTIKPVNLVEAEAERMINVRVNDTAYTGKALKPAVQVYETVDGKERKLSGSAYTLSYANNTEKGTGTVTVTGKDKFGYTGTIAAEFRIVDKAKLISASAIKIDTVPGQTFTGSAVEPVLHIVDKSDKNKEVTLEKGTHYEVTYRNNVNAGKATVTVRGIGSYAGSRDVTFKINKCAIADKNVLGAGFTVENPADMKYTGYALKPDVVIKDKGVTLAQGKDYKLSYKNNTKIGTALVTVQGIGDYSGSYKAVSFQITAWDYNTLTAEIEDQTYTGKALKPQVKFYMTGENGREEILLKPNTAVKIAYKDNTNVGTATVTITGKGELDKITPIMATFGIEHADLSEAVVSRIPNQTLKGAAVKPIPKVKVGRNSLKAGRDFTTSYQRNGVKGEATVTIKGIGNYTGECRKTFIVQ